MTGFTSSQAQDAAASSSQTLGLLAAFKAGSGAGNAGGSLFASLLAETKDSLPEVKVADPKPAPTASLAPSAPAANARRDDDQPAAATQDDTVAQATADDRQQAAQTKADKNRRAESKKETSQTATCDQDQTAPAQTQTPKAQAQTVKPEAKDERAAQATLAAGIAADDQKEEDKDAQTDDAATLGAAAVLVPLDDKVQTKKKDVLEETTQKSDAADDRTTALLQGAVGVTMTAPAATETKKKATTKTEASTGVEQTEALTAQTAKTNEALPQQEDKSARAEKTADNLPSAKAEAALTDKTVAAKTEQAQTLAPTQTAQTTAAPDAQAQPSFAEALKKIDLPAAVPALGAAGASAALGGEPHEGQGVSGVSGTSASGAQTNVLAAGESVKPANSYDFASQLSAARVTKGGTAGLPQAVEQVAVQINKAAKDGQSDITIQLRPAELGKIEVKLEITADNKVQATVTADKAATLTLLQNDSGALQHALQDAGLQVDQGSLQFSLRGDGGQGAFAQNQNGSSHTTSWAYKDNAANDDELTGLDALGDVTTLTPGRVNLRV